MELLLLALMFSLFFNWKQRREKLNPKKIKDATVELYEFLRVPIDYEKIDKAIHEYATKVM